MLIAISKMATKYRNCSKIILPMRRLNIEDWYMTRKKKEYLNVKWFDVDVDKLLFYGRCWVSNWLSAKPSIVPCGHMMRNKATFIYSLYFDAKGQFEGYINWSIYKMIQINGQWSMLRSNERIKNDRVDNNPSSIKCSKTSLTTNIELNRVL